VSAGNGTDIRRLYQYIPPKLLLSEALTSHVRYDLKGGLFVMSTKWHASPNFGVKTRLLSSKSKVGYVWQFIGFWLFVCYPRHYQDAYEMLLIMFGSTAILPPRTKRWAEAKVLADCINIKVGISLNYHSACYIFCQLIRPDRKALSIQQWTRTCPFPSQHPYPTIWWFFSRLGYWRRNLWVLELGSPTVSLSTTFICSA